MYDIFSTLSALKRTQIMSKAYYNEIDPKAAKWLRELINENLIAPGDVDERDIRDIKPNDLNGYTQCHFFAGIGTWSYALRNAGWADDRQVWTGSCPCQPFSSAGKGAGFTDERHLWPAWFHLIRECKPDVVFAEQVAGKDGLKWLDLVQADLETEGYAVGPADLCAASVGSPHIRQRLWVVAKGMADTHGRERDGRSEPAGGDERHGDDSRRQEGDGGAALSCETSGMGHADPNGCESGGEAAEASRYGSSDDPAGRAGGMANPNRDRANELARNDEQEAGLSPEKRQPEDGSSLSQRTGGDDDGLRPDRGDGLRGDQPSPLPTNGFWADPDWLFCRDGKWRPVESGSSPLADGSPSRVVEVRGYGNGIVAPLAQLFIEAAMDSFVDRVRII